MSISQKQRSAQRDKVLLAARRCFVRHGFHATGMAEIGKACRMSTGNIYHYFPNKDAIVSAIADETRSRLLPALRRLENHPDPIEGVIEIILLGVREFCRGEDARLWIEITAEAARNKVVRELYTRLDRDIRGVLKGLMRKAIRGRQIARDMDLEATSVWLVALLDGAITRVSIDPDADVSRTLDTLAASIRHCLCPECGSCTASIQTFSRL